MPRGIPGTQVYTNYSCRQCGKEFQDFPSTKRVFCSRRCQGSASGVRHNKPHSQKTRDKLSAIGKGKTSNMRGKKHSLDSKIKLSCSQRGILIKDFDGFQKTKDALERMRFRREMQSLVFERDNYSCVECKKRGALQVAHIKSWKDFPELRFSLDNCRTLCMGCHYEETFNKNKPQHIRAWGHNLKHSFQER